MIAPSNISHSWRRAYHRNRVPLSSQAWAESMAHLYLDYAKRFQWRAVFWLLDVAHGQDADLPEDFVNTTTRAGRSVPYEVGHAGVAGGAPGDP